MCLLSLYNNSNVFAEKFTDFFFYFYLTPNFFMLVYHGFYKNIELNCIQNW